MIEAEALEVVHKAIKTGIYALVSSYTGAGVFYLSENLHLGIILAALTGMVFISLEMEAKEQ